MADLLKNAAERVLTGLLPVLDDFERGLAACSANEADEAIYKGMEWRHRFVIAPPG